MVRETKKFVIDVCEKCLQRHTLTVQFTQLFTTMVWPPKRTTVLLKYSCPVNGNTATFSADFDGVVEDVEVVSVALDETLEIVFQYGSNCSTTRLNSGERLGGAAHPRGIAETVQNYQLQFDVWSDGNNCAAADIVKTPGKKVWGVLYDIPADFVRGRRKDKKKTLEQIEGQRYEAVCICVRDRSGVEQEATTFVARPNERRSGIRTSLDYVRHIITGLREQAVCDEYIQEVKRIAAENNPSIRQDVEPL